MKCRANRPLGNGLQRLRPPALSTPRTFHNPKPSAWTLQPFGLSGPPTPDGVNAYKDVVKSLPGTVTRLIMKFLLPSSVKLVSGEHHKYIWHCHILEHEDNEMMRPIDAIVP